MLLLTLAQAVAVVASVRAGAGAKWCKGCCVIFLGGKCPRGHASWMHSPNLPEEEVREVEARAVSDLPCNIRREGGQSLVIGGTSFVILDGKGV